MKTTIPNLRHAIRNIIKESSYVDRLERAKPYIIGDQSLFYWLRQNYNKGFSIDMYALEPARTPEHVMDMMDIEPALQGLKVVGTISNRIPGFGTYLFREEPSYDYTVVQADYKTGRGIIAKGFGNDAATLAQIVNHMIKRNPPPNPELDKYITAF